MFTLVHVSRSSESSATTSALVAEYLSFQRQRRESRPYLHGFGGLSVLVALGGVVGLLPPYESIVAVAVFALPAGVLLGVNLWRGLRLKARLGVLRTEIHQPIHKKVIKNS